MDPTNKVTGTDPKNIKAGTDKPEGIPPSKQDFEKILDDQKKSKQGQGSKNFSAEGEELEGESVNLPSPFDLPKTRLPKGESALAEVPVFGETPKKTTIATPKKTFSSDMKSLATDDSLVSDKPVTDKSLVSDKPVVLDKPVTSEKTPIEEIPTEGVVLPKTLEPKSDSKLQFSKEMPDLSQVNPLGAQMTTVAPIQGVELTATAATPQVDMKRLIAEIVDAIQTMTNAGETKTTITLSGSALLNGAQIVITSFESAPKEFNVAFENLSPDAKRIMDLSGNQQALMTGFKDNGMVLHIVTTNTQFERPVYTGSSAGGSPSKEREDAGDQPKDKKQRQ